MITPYIEHRPWGMFEKFCENMQCTVKVLTIEPHQSISLQFHHHRDEFWKILDGSARIIIGDQIIDATAGEEFFIPRETKHRIEAVDETVDILEIALGEFDENDITRLEDRYHRV